MSGTEPTAPAATRPPDETADSPVERVAAAPGIKLLVVNQYYAPDIAASGQLLSELCAGLSQRGIDVHVVAAQPSYTADAPDTAEHETVDGVEVERVSVGRSKGRATLRTRGSGYVKFTWRAWRAASRIAERDNLDAVLTFSNPPTVGLIGARLAARLGLDYVYVIHDIHPDVEQLTGALRFAPGVGFAWDTLNRWILRHASRVIVPSHAMRTTLISQKSVPPEKIGVIPIWGRPELSPGPGSGNVQAELGIGDQDLLLLSSGNMGVMHPLDIVLDAAANTRDLPVRYLFIGDGVRKQALQARARSLGLSNVAFMPYQKEHRFVELLQAADACFVPLLPGMEGLAVPSRSYTFMSAAKPLIALMTPEAEIARLAVNHQCGWNVQDGEALASLVRHLHENRHKLRRSGASARLVYERFHMRDAILDAYADVIKAAVHA